MKNNLLATNYLPTIEQKKMVCRKQFENSKKKKKKSTLFTLEGNQESKRSNKKKKKDTNTTNKHNREQKIHIVILGDLRHTLTQLLSLK